MNAISEVETEDEFFWRIPPDQLIEVSQNLEARCKKAGIEFKAGVDKAGESDHIFKFGEGRGKRILVIWDQNDLVKLDAIEFEKYTFLSGLQAICNYEAGTIEAMVDSVGSDRNIQLLFKKLFGMNIRDARSAGAELCVEVLEGDPEVKFGLPTEAFTVLTNTTGPIITIKISKLSIRQHDEALKYLTTIAGSLLFQLDLSSGIPLAIKRVGGIRRKTIRLDPPPVLTFPRVEFDSAPLSLYWYGRSAVGMPLLQYLAFYQVIEFYFPRYSQSEAHRKLKSVLKDPTFRAEKDSDVARLLDAIHISKSGAFGDERSQLKAVLEECTYSDEIKSFISRDRGRLDFFSVKSKASYHKININSEGGDLRLDVSRRIYEIRCKIVHTKSDARDLEIKMLLPFSVEADQLQFDIELIQYVAQKVLIAGGTYVDKL